MTAQRPRLPAVLCVGAVTLGIVIAHSVAYLGTYPFGPEFARGMSNGGHDAYWPLLLIASAVLTGAGLITAWSRARFTLVSHTRLRSATILWMLLAASSFVGFLGLEDAEALMRGAPAPGLAPLAQLADPATFATALALLALLAWASLEASRARRPYEHVLTSSYGDLVASGVYSRSWEHSTWAIDFVSDVMSRFLAERATEVVPPRVLECGCGTGVWLSTAARVLGPSGASLAGFDLSPAMTDVARVRLADIDPPVELHVGDVLDDLAYTVGISDRHDLVFAFDVVQQLPREVQWDAIVVMLRHVEEGGWLVVFDNDAKSRFGREMGFKKWLRRYFNIPLVPRFYIHARYPDLKSLRRQAEQASKGSAEILVAPGLRKRALIVRLPNGRPPAHEVT